MDQNKNQTAMEKKNDYWRLVWTALFFFVLTVVLALFLCFTNGIEKDNTAIIKFLKTTILVALIFNLVLFAISSIILVLDGSILGIKNIISRFKKMETSAEHAEQIQSPQQIQPPQQAQAPTALQVPPPTPPQPQSEQQSMQEETREQGPETSSGAAIIENKEYTKENVSASLEALAEETLKWSKENISNNKDLEEFLKKLEEFLKEQVEDRKLII